MNLGSLIVSKSDKKARHPYFGYEDTDVSTICAALVAALASGGASDSALLEASDDEIERAARAARDVKMLGPFLAGVEASRGGLPRSLEVVAEAYRRASIAINMAVLSHVVDVVEAFERSSLPVLVFKGPIQQDMFYGTYFMRPSSDIDLLVSRSDFRPALACLRDIGFKAAAGSDSMWWEYFLGERHLVRPGARPVTADLHHRLQQPGSPQPRHPAAFLANRTTARFRGRSIPVLTKGDTALLCAMSIVKAFFNREPAAGHTCDLFLAVGGRDGGGVAPFLANARDQGIEGTARLALRFVEAVFAVTYPAMDGTRETILPNLSTTELQAMIVAPRRLPRFPSRRQILRTACAGDRLVHAREVGWMVLSDIARRVSTSPPPPR